MGSYEEYFKIIIVGGGIAGLSTAIALRAPNRNIIVLERSRMLHEVGALISLQPNATKIVSQWNIDGYLKKSEPMADRSFRIFDLKGELVREIGLDPSLFGADRMVYHRQDLHAGLLEAATSESLPGTPAEIRTSSVVMSCDPFRGSVTLESGEILEADLIIGADGIHSVIRTAVVGGERKALPTGTSAYRMLIPTKNLHGLSLPNALIDKENPSTTMVIGHDKRVIMGPGRAGKLLGIVALVPDGKLNEETIGNTWVQQGSLEKLMESFADFPDWLKQIFNQCPDVALWQLRDIDPLDTWTKGRTILIGDAAHAMLPTQGQGASQSIEDAEALQAFFSHITVRPSDSDVRSALEKVFSARHERATLIQLYSRQQAKTATDESTKQITLDPVQFMKYNCDYHGAVHWLEKTCVKA